MVLMKDCEQALGRVCLNNVYYYKQITNMHFRFKFLKSTTLNHFK